MGDNFRVFTFLHETMNLQLVFEKADGIYLFCSRLIMQSKSEASPQCSHKPLTILKVSFCSHLLVCFFLKSTLCFSAFEGSDADSEQKVTRITFNLGLDGKELSALCVLHICTALAWPHISARRLNGSLVTWNVSWRSLWRRVKQLCVLSRWEVAVPRPPRSQTGLPVHGRWKFLGGEIPNKKTCAKGRCK